MGHEKFYYIFGAMKKSGQFCGAIEKLEKILFIN